MLGAQTLAYNAPKVQSTWESHGEDGFYVGPCYFHYRLMEHFITTTRSYRKTQSAQFYPTHCGIPTISEAEKSIMAASEMLKLLQIAVLSAKNKCRRIKNLNQLTLIMSGGQHQRVATSTPTRVAKTASTLHNITSLISQSHQTNPSVSNAFEYTNVIHHGSRRTTERKR